MKRKKEGNEGEEMKRSKEMQKDYKGNKEIVTKVKKDTYNMRLRAFERTKVKSYSVVLYYLYRSWKKKMKSNSLNSLL